MKHYVLLQFQSLGKGSVHQITIQHFRPSFFGLRLRKTNTVIYTNDRGQWSGLTLKGEQFRPHPELITWLDNAFKFSTEEIAGLCQVL